MNAQRRPQAWRLGTHRARPQPSPEPRLQRWTRQDSSVGLRLSHPRSLNGDRRIAGRRSLVGEKQLLGLRRRRMCVRHIATLAAQRIRSPVPCQPGPPPALPPRAEPSREFRPRGSRIGTPRVSVQERASPCERCELFGDCIVQLLIDRGCRSGLNGDERRVPVGGQGNEVLEAKRPENDIRPNPNSQGENKSVYESLRIRPLAHSLPPTTQNNVSSTAPRCSSIQVACHSESIGVVPNVLVVTKPRRGAYGESLVGE